MGFKWRGGAVFKMGNQKVLTLGNLDSKRDWGHARDYVEAMWKMLQQKKPDDYVIATGRTETVRKFVEISASKIGWESEKGQKGIYWEGEGLNEVGRRADNDEIVIRIDPRYFSPTEVDHLQGDSSKAFAELGWEAKTSLEKLIEEMISNDIKEAKKELILKNKGFSTLNSVETIPNIMN